METKEEVWNLILEQQELNYDLEHPEILSMPEMDTKGKQQKIIGLLQKQIGMKKWQKEKVLEAILEYESAMDTKNSYLREVSYKQGFKQGVQFLLEILK